MKQKDIALIIVIAAISGFISFFAARFLFATPANRQQKVEVVDKITSEFPTPSPKYFNPNSIDAAQLIQVTDNQNPNPFNGAGQ
jgi:hypothetical protein